MVNVFSNRALLALLVLLVSAGGCTTPRTEVILAVDMDARAALVLDRFNVEVIDPAGISRFANSSVTDLPRTLGISWTQGPLGPFTIRVTGERRGVATITRVARFTFIPQETRVLHITLTGNCATTVCSTTETCAETGCRAWDIQPSELEPWTGTIDRRDGGALPADAGPADANPMRFDAFVVPIDAVVPMPDAFTEMPDAFVDPDAFIEMPDAPDALTSPPDALVIDARAVDACMPMAEVCNLRDDNCNAMVDEGFDLIRDEANCGSCGNVCDLPNASNRCASGMCGVRDCDIGFANCDATAMNGCEVNVNTDALYCRICGNACGGATPLCCRGACAATCP